MAIFDVLNGFACFNFSFILGEPDMVIANITSPPICFRNTRTLGLMADYSTAVALGRKFQKPLTISVRWMQNE
jgi:hypothetical protein